MIMTHVLCPGPVSGTQAISFTPFMDVYTVGLIVSCLFIDVKTEASCSHAAMSLCESHIPRWSLVFLGMTGGKYVFPPFPSRGDFLAFEIP